MDREARECLAGVVRLLRRAASLTWQRATADGVGSSWQVLAIGVDIVADEAAMLLPAGYLVEGPTAVGEEPVRLLRSAEQLLDRLHADASKVGLEVLRSQVADLVWEANSGADA